MLTKKQNRCYNLNVSKKYCIYLVEEYPSWLKGPVLKTGRSCKRRVGSNPTSSAIYFYYISRGGAAGSSSGS